MSVARAADLIRAVADEGVTEFCVCPGGRNAPLALVLARARGVTVRTFFDERSAAFFALGRTRATGRPAAVVTTSGTAAAELLPAVVEAYYAGLPLVLITADRPPTYRGTGSPQAIEQVNVFAPYTPTAFDGTRAGDRPTLDDWDRARPVHLNVCFDEPLLDAPIPTLSLAPTEAPRSERAPDTAAVSAFLAARTRPLALVGPLSPDDRSGVRTFLGRLGAPVYAEPASHLREDAALRELVLTSGERVLRHGGFDGVLRVGGVPTVRLWRDLETTLPDVPVCSVTPTGFAGLTRGTVVRGRPGTALAQVTAGAVDRAWRDEVLAHDAGRRAALDAALEREPRAEPALVRALSTLVPPGSLVYLGNSLPVREWDLAAIREARGWRVGANRGANGIDGQVSTFLGMCEPGREHWAVLGDLTTLYDLSAPWVLPQLAVGPIRIAIVNNGGGQIFARLASYAELRNAHGVGFEHWARMWDLAYERWEAVPAAASLPDRVVLEIAPDPGATARFWEAHDRLDDAP